jgi:sigma-B regulation protein RsbU (phosphoserine phosphatase)
MKKSTRHSLSRRVTLIQLALMITMVAILAVSSYMVFRRTYLRFYNQKGQDIVRIVAAQTDWEQLEHFAETGEPDSYSESLTEFYNSVKMNFTGVGYLYLFVPGETSFTYLIEAQTPEDDPEWVAHWGDIFEYTSYEYEKLLPDVRAGKPSTEIMFMETALGAGIETWAPVFDASGNVRAMVEADYELTDLEKEIDAFVLRIVLFILLCTLVFLTVMFLYMRRSIVQPIVRLNASVDSYEHGDFDLQLEKFRTDDELRNLAVSFTDMTRRIDAYTEEVARATEEQGRISAEYNVAKQIQTDILPSEFPAFPERRDFDIYASLYSSREICGDYYDFFLIDEDHLAMVLGDVSGKGVPAAMFMVIVKTLIKNRALQGFSPAEVLQNVSEQLVEGNNAGMYATVWLAVLELSTGKGMAANAGAEHPVLRRAGKRFELQEYRHSPPVGAMEGVRFRDHGFQLEPGDTLFVYTDGVKEPRNKREETFGTAGILEALNREPEATPSVLLQTMKTTIDSFTGEAIQADDITMLSLKYYGTAKPSDEWK